MTVRYIDADQDQLYPDVGCRYEPSCLRGPRSVCIEELTPRQKTAAMYTERYRVVGGMPGSVKGVMAATGLSARTVHRARRAVSEGAA